MDQNRDSEDAETSSEGSWDLLNNDEPIADLTSVEDNINVAGNSLKEVMNGSDVRIKIIQSDTDSDGISILDESDYYQISETDDYYNNTAIETQSGMYEMNDDMAIKQDELLNGKHTKKQYEKFTIFDTNNSANKYLVNEENCSFHEDETMGNVDLEKDIPDVVEAEHDATIEKLSFKKMNGRLTEETSVHIYLNHLKQLVSWASFLCTSVVIFTVIIFPYFSSKIDNANSLDQPDIKEFDEISLTDRNIGVLDSLDVVNCMQIIKEDNDNSNFKQCMEKLLKHRKRFKNNDLTLQFISSSKLEDKDSNLIEYTYTFPLKKKYKHMEEYNKYANGKYRKLSKNIMEYYDVNGEDIEEYDEKNTLTNKNKNKYFAKFENSQQEDNNAKEKNCRTQFEREAFDKSKNQLEELRISLLENEKFLKKWQEQLTQMEFSLKDKIKKNYHYKNKCFKKHKRELDKDECEKIYNRCRKQKHESILNIKQKKYKKQVENPVKCTDKKRIKGTCRMKGIFHKKHQRNYNGKKEVFLAFLRENIHNESTEKLNITFNSKYLKVPSIAKKNRTNIADENNTVDGEWYINLVHGRHDIRKREGRASWWFDRAEFRKNRRNKAFWYFQYMINRENLRYQHNKFQIPNVVNVN